MNHDSVELQIKITPPLHVYVSTQNRTYSNTVLYMHAMRDVCEVCSSVELGLHGLGCQCSTENYVMRENDKRMVVSRCTVKPCCKQGCVSQSVL